MANLDTQRTETTHICEANRTATGTMQYLLEKSSTGVNVDYTTNNTNNLQVFICGEQSFRQIARDIENAKSHIDIICWGFDPAMELRRSRSKWPRCGLGGQTGTHHTYGGLLRAAVARGVSVRLLAWYGFWGNMGIKNLKDHEELTTTQIMDRRVKSGLIKNKPQYDSHLNALHSEPGWERRDFNAQWFQDAKHGRITGKNGATLALRTRNIDADTVDAAMGEGQRGMDYEEVAGLKLLVTYHQKTILIDYPYQGGEYAVGYVMGLNSVTDYWDTADHLYEDEQRGQMVEGDDDDSGLESLKPYQDYVCRIRGESLFALNRNFANAWANGVDCGKAVCATPEGSLIQPYLSRATKAPYHRAQILRTQPAADGGEAAIWALYQQASTQAMRYIYVENQYFQYADWAALVVENRKKYVSDYLANIKAVNQKIAERKGTPLRDTPPDLHIFIVTPSPERTPMVPRTNDTITTLGVANSMPNQDKLVDERQNAYKKQKDNYDLIMRHGTYIGSPPPKPVPPGLNAMEKDAQKARDIGASISKDGTAIKTLVVNLWTQDRHFNSPTWDEPQLSLGEKLWHPTEAGQKAALDEKIAKRYREIYIHSKLMILDDAMFTLGSANLNYRSMHTDSEINIATDDYRLVTDLRKRVWALHATANGQDTNVTAEALAGGDGSLEAIKQAFDKWKAIASDNLINKDNGKPLTGYIVKFRDLRVSHFRLA